MRERALRRNVQSGSGYNAKPFSGLGALQTAVSFSAGPPACALFGALFGAEVGRACETADFQTSNYLNA